MIGSRFSERQLSAASKADAARRSLPGLVAVCVAGVCWGTAPVAFDIVNSRTGLGSFAISSYRLLIATIALVAIAGVTRNLRSVWAAIRQKPLLILGNGAGVACYQALWFAAIPRVGASVATVLSLGLAPVLITAWESSRARVRPSPARLLALLTAVSGLTLVSLSAAPAQRGASDVPIGLIAAGGSGIVYALTTVLGRRAAQSVPPLSLAATSSAVGALCLAPFAVAAGIPVLGQPSTGALLAYLGVVATTVPALLLYTGLRTTTPGVASIATLLEPVTATVLATTLLAEPITAPAAWGIGLIVVAIAVIR